MKKVDNPFLIYGYEGPEYFCDRKRETAEVIEALCNGCNLTLMSPRRYGKTGLIRNAFYLLEKQRIDVQCFYVDIYATKTLGDFVAMLGKCVLGKLDSPLKKAGDFIGGVIKSAKVTLTPDYITGVPEIGLTFQPQYTKNTLEEIFEYLRLSGKQCYIAIDEFQQITEYPDDNVEELLRTYVQQMHNVHFIFAGSKLHMMSEMFGSPRHPFYRSTERMNLHVIDEKVYYDFAQDKLNEKKVTISPFVFSRLYGLVDGVTWYVQTILNRLYRLSECEVTEGLLNKIIDQILMSEEDYYKRQVHQLTIVQVRLLSAIAKEGMVAEALSGKFVHAHGLKSTSSVQRALQSLMDEEYVYQTENGYIVYDRFLGMWLKRR